MEKITDEVSEDYIDREYTARTSPIRSVRHESPLTAISASKKACSDHTDEPGTPKRGDTPTKTSKDAEEKEKEPRGYHGDSESASGSSSSTDRAPTGTPPPTGSSIQATPYVTTSATTRAPEPFGATSEIDKTSHGACHDAYQTGKNVLQPEDHQAAAHTRQNGAGLRRTERAESHVSLLTYMSCMYVRVMIAILTRIIVYAYVWPERVEESHVSLYRACMHDMCVISDDCNFDTHCIRIYVAWTSRGVTHEFTYMHVVHTCMSCMYARHVCESDDCNFDTHCLRIYVA